MGEHHEKHTIFGPFPDADPLDTARLFLRTNRYQIVIEESGPAPAAMQVDASIIEPTADEESPEPESEEEVSSDESEEHASDEDASEEDEDESEKDEDESEEDEDESVEDEDESEEDEDESVEDEDESEEDTKSDLEESEPEEENGDVVLKLQATRGERWSGFTSSNMADLQTTIDLALVSNSIQVSYTVTTTGQFLNEDERAFWKREAQALERFVTGGDLVSVVSDESARASRARRDLLGSGMWVAAVIFVVVFVLGVLYARFG